MVKHGKNPKSIDTKYRNFNKQHGVDDVSKNPDNPVARLQSQVIVLDVQVHVRQDELEKSNTSARCTANVERDRTSSLIFFQMMRVISSPSSSTTGFFTAIFCAAATARRVYQRRPLRATREPLTRPRRLRERAGGERVHREGRTASGEAAHVGGARAEHRLTGG